MRRFATLLVVFVLLFSFASCTLVKLDEAEKSNGVLIKPSSDQSEGSSSGSIKEQLDEIRGEKIGEFACFVGNWYCYRGPIKNSVEEIPEVRSIEIRIDGSCEYGDISGEWCPVDNSFAVAVFANGNFIDVISYDKGKESICIEGKNGTLFTDWIDLNLYETVVLNKQNWNKYFDMNTEFAVNGEDCGYYLSLAPKEKYAERLEYLIGYEVKIKTKQVWAFGDVDFEKGTCVITEDLSNDPERVYTNIHTVTDKFFDIQLSGYEKDVRRFVGYPLSVDLESIKGTLVFKK